jgi:hypothetical protein
MVKKQEVETPQRLLEMKLNHPKLVISSCRLTPRRADGDLPTVDDHAKQRRLQFIIEKPHLRNFILKHIPPFLVARYI